jgi:hypothetical protein
MQTCSCCGLGYKTRNKNEDILIYGCRNCHKGDWQSNEKSLTKSEIMTNEKFFIYGKSLK